MARLAPCPKHARAATTLLAIGASVLAAVTWSKRHRRTQQTHEWDIAISNARAQTALEELQTEEMRVRRVVSDQLHGTLQNRMVLITAGIDAVARSLAASGDTERADQLTALAGDLEELREREVRDLSHALFPAGIELGAIRAIQALINRLPPQIEVGLHLGAALKSRVDEGGPLMPLAERLIVVSVVEEAITNALKHGGATRLTLELELDPTTDGTGQVLRGAVVDNGRGIGGSSRPVGAGGKGGDGGRGLSADAVGAGGAVFVGGDGAADAAAGGQATPGADWVVSGKPDTTGLRRTAERFRKRGGYLRLEQADDGGARLEFSLPLPREWDA